MKVNYDVEGDIFNIQRFSLNDGPGIRTIVFLKGCPFTCWWCSNPESQKKRPVVMYNEDDCLFCRRCEAACKGGRITFDAAGKHHLDQEHCSGCGECVQACPAGALVLKGRKMSVAALVKELKKDSSTFRHSGGGITLSGGDPLTQPEFSEELLKACKAQGWSTAMETEGGVVNPEAIEQIFPYVDHVLLDIKHMDPENTGNLPGRRMKPCWTTQGVSHAYPPSPSVFRSYQALTIPKRRFRRLQNLLRLCRALWVYICSRTIPWARTSTKCWAWNTK